MKNTLMILSVLVFFSNCNTYEKSYYENGQLKYIVPINEAGKRHGKLIKYYADGGLQYESYWINGNKEGKATLYFRDGKTNIVENYIDNKPNGKIIEYDSVGNIIRVIMYNKGVMENEKSYFSTGELKGIVMLVGDSIFTNYYHKNGKLDEKSLRVYDKLIYAKKFDTEGTLLSSNLPIVAEAIFRGTYVDLNIQLTYTDCVNCSFLVILGEFDSNKKLSKELFRDNFDSKIINIRLDRSRYVNNKDIRGLFYELDANNSVIGFSPFNITTVKR